MGRRGPRPDADEAKAKRGSWRTKKRPRHKHTERKAKGRKTRLNNRRIEEICRTGIPGYDPWADAGGYRFDFALARKAINFFHTKLTHVKGAKAGQPFYLEHWEIAIVGNLFGWVSTQTGLRRYRECFALIARKNGKTPLVAGIILYLLFEDGEPGAEIYGAASEYKQASLVFEHARGMVLQCDELRERCKIYSGQAKSIQLEQDDYPTYRVISSDAGSAHGMNTHGAAIDELHALDSRDLVDAIMTSTGARRQPLIIEITTSDFDRPSICNEKQDYAEKIRDGIISDPSFLPVIFKADRDDDWTAPATWKKANPNLGVSVSVEYLQRECKRAQEQPSYENTFKRLHLNIRTEQDVRWIQMAAWDACSDDVKEKELAGVPAYGALDLASTIDIAAWLLVFPLKDKRYALRARFFVPEDNAHEREHRDRVPYLTWARQGLIELTPGNVIDFDYIRKAVKEDGERYEIVDIGYDPWNATQLATQLAEQDGFEMVQFRQGFVSMNEPSKELEKLILKQRLMHGGNAVLRWMASNVTVMTDAAGNIKPDKQRSHEKIDGIVALVMAIGRAMLRTEKGSVYKKRGIITL